jgi:hypothetical protein
MSNGIPRWKLLGRLGLPPVALGLPLYARFRRDIRSLAEQIPGAELLTLECGGHLMLGQRERTIPAIRRFLCEHCSTQP